MATFHLYETVPLPQGSVITSLLGVDANTPLTDKDVNKCVKLAASDNYVPVTAGDDFEGMVVAVEPGTRGNGFSFGSVQRYFHFIEAEVVGATLSVGATVVAAAQNALGTAQDLPKVQAGDGVNFKWRVVSRLGGDGTAGTTVLISPIKL